MRERRPLATRRAPHGRPFLARRAPPPDARRRRRRRRRSRHRIVAVAGVAYATWALLFLPVWILIAKLIGLYDRDHRSIRHLTLDELPSIAAWAGLGVAGLGLFMGLTDRGVLTVPEALLAGVVALFLGALFRSAARMLYRRITRPS